MIDSKLPSNWAWVKLGDIAKIKGGKRLPKGNVYSTEKTNYPYIRVIDFDRMTIDQSNLKYLDLETHQVIKSYTISHNDLYISIAGSIGKVGRIPKNLDGANLTENAAKITCIKNFDLDCLKFYLNSQSAQVQIKRNTIATTQPKLALFRIEKINIPQPPLIEQQKIVSKIEELFSEIDNGIENLKKAKEQIKIYRQAVLKYAFEGKLTKDTLNNIADVDHLNGVQEGKELPAGWKWVKLGNMTEKIKMVQKKNINMEEEFIYYDIGGINNCLNKIESFKKYKWKEAPSRARQIVMKGDILFSTVRTYLKNIAHLTNEYENQIASTGFCIIRPKEKILCSKFIFQYTLYKEFLKSLNALQTGSSYPAVRDKDVFNQIIPLPPLNEQNQIVEEIESRFSVADQLEQTIDESLSNAQALKQSILKQAFEGRLV